MPNDALPFGVGGPAEPEVPASPLVGNLIAGLLNIPKHLIDASTEAVPGLRKEDVTDNPNAAEPNAPLYKAAADTAMGVMGASGAMPATANELRMGIKAYHASPHDFDAFDLSKMGTGEGTAKFGKGIYAAENPNVTDYYLNQFGPKAQAYHLDINAEPHQFFDWDKLVTPDLVKQVITKPKDAGVILDYLKETGKAGKELTGQELYTNLAKATSPEYATNLFSQAGVPGFKYLDAGSRMKGLGTSNYTVFDPSLINILKKEKFGEFDPYAITGPQPVSEGDVFRQQALEARDAFFHQDVQPIQRKFKEDLMPLDERRIARGYTTPAFKGGKLGFSKDLNPDFADYSIKNGGGSKSNFYSTSDPELANMYAGQYFEHGMPHNPLNNEYSTGGVVTPLYLDTSKYHVLDAGGRNITTQFDKAKEEAARLGAPGVTIKNTWDEPSFTKTLKNPQDVHITFPEGLGTVKSRFAKEFDPTSSNMMKGVGAVGTGTVADMVNSLKNKKDENGAQGKIGR